MILGVVASSMQSGVNYSIANATYNGVYNPTPDIRSLEVANGKAYPAWAGSIYQYTYDESDITNWSDDSNTGTGYLSSIADTRWSPDGNNLALTQADQRLFNYAITTSFDASARSTRTEISFSNELTGNIRAFYTKPDGTKLYIGDQTGNAVYQYSLSTAGLVTSATYDSKSATIHVDTDYIAALCISPDGKYLLIGDADDDVITEYEMSTPWDVSTATQNTGNTLDISSYVALVYSIRYKPDGSGIWLVDYMGQDVTQYDLNN